MTALLSPKTGLGVLQAELGVLQMAMSDAVQRAAAGEPAEGFAILLDGRRRVDEVAEAGEAWARDLARVYHSALDQFDREYCAKPR